MSQHSYSVFRGGLPVLHKNQKGRGSIRYRNLKGRGFFSSLKRFLLPLAKRLLPHALNAVQNIAQGKPVADTLKVNAMDAGADLLEEVASKGVEKMKSYANKKRTSKEMSGAGRIEYIKDVGNSNFFKRKPHIQPKSKRYKKEEQIPAVPLLTKWL